MEYLRLRGSTRILTAFERNKRLAKSELLRNISLLKLPKRISLGSLNLYLLALKKGIIRGRSMESVIAASIYTVCKKEKRKISIKKLCKISEVPLEEIEKTYEILKKFRLNFKEKLDKTEESQRIKGKQWEKLLEDEKKANKKFWNKEIKAIIKLLANFSYKLKMSNKAIDNSGLFLENLFEMVLKKDNYKDYPTRPVMPIICVYFYSPKKMSLNELVKFLGESTETYWKAREFIEDFRPYLEKKTTSLGLIKKLHFPY